MKAPRFPMVVLFLSAQRFAKCDPHPQLSNCNVLCVRSRHVRSSHVEVQAGNLRSEGTTHEERARRRADRTTFEYRSGLSPPQNNPQNYLQAIAKSSDRFGTLCYDGAATGHVGPVRGRMTHGSRPAGNPTSRTVDAVDRFAAVRGRRRDETELLHALTDALAGSCAALPIPHS
jgi:hypothetical protein